MNCIFSVSTVSRIRLNSFWLVLIFLNLGSLVYSQNFYNVIEFGADKSGKVVAGESINAAIDSASKNGGGTVFFPAGEYLTGPIHLKSNITILIDAGAVLRFSDDFDLYLPMVESRWEGVDVFNFSPLIYANNAENITITGRGTIDGQGKKWWDTFFAVCDSPEKWPNRWQKEFYERNKGMLMPDNPERFEMGFLRPPFIQPVFCKNVRIEGITIVNSPFWTVNPEFCENVTITGITILNPPSPNTDGINPESCKNVHISDCHISVGDDCITIKSGKDAPGRKKAIPAENYTITNCTMLSGHGGVVIGSEMSGDVRKIAISNCVFDGTDRGIRIKSTRGRGGVVEDITVNNIIVKNVKYEAVKLNLHYTKTKVEAVSERTPQFRNIHVNNLTGTAKQAIVVIGLEEMPVKDISFTNINLQTELGIKVRHTKNIRFSQIQIANKLGSAISIDSSTIVEIDGLKCLNPLSEIPLIHLNDVDEVYIHNCYQPVETDLFIEITGNESKNIVAAHNNIKKIKTALKVAPEVDKETKNGLKKGL